MNWKYLKRRNEFFYVYIYLDPTKPGKYSYCNGNITFDYEPFYVGEGKGKRGGDHLGQASNLENAHHKHNRIRKIWREGSQPFIWLYETEISEEIALHIETLLIAKIGRADKKLGPLTNLTDGGDRGANGAIRSEETRRKYSLSKMGDKNPNFGKVLTEEEKRPCSQPGDQNGNWKGGKTVKNIIDICPICGREFLNTIGRKYVTCGSSICRGKLLTLTHSKEKAWGWKGGINGCKRDQKHEIWNRDNNICMNPGCTGKGSFLCVHYIDYNKANIEWSNLITLCNSCHSKANFNRLYWTEFLASILKEKYGY
jgi:hypothetical protein